MSKKNSQKGQVSKLLLVLAIIVLVAVVITYLVMKMATRPPTPPAPGPATGTLSLPVYDQTIENILFSFNNARDRGNVLKASDAINQSSWQKDLTTTDKFIEVTITAQNIGKENIEEKSWDLGNIVDSKGRIYHPDDSYTVSAWLPSPNLCGTLLKPAFQPTPCIKIYEVSRESTGLKIYVVSGIGNASNNMSAGKTEQKLIDINLLPKR